MLIPFINLPSPMRSLLIVLVALLAARFVNWAIVNWAYNQRSFGPWAAAVGKGARRTWHDHLPVLGWYRLRRESKQYGRGYWIRPLLIELLFPLMTVWYYNFYVSGLPLGQAAKLLQPELHCQFAGHFVLFVLMTIATFIDFDEQSIPDYVTVSGTVLGLLGAAWAPAWLPFHANPLTELHANVPAAWPLWLNGAWGLGIGMTILLVWCFALLDRRWIVRRGLAKGVQYFFARMFRHPLLWKLLFVVTACLLMVVTAVWYFPFGSARWPYLLSSLLGLAFAGGVTWAVRLSATWGLRVEALGFGDVTLMAMIGTFVGWQPSLLIFFIAPLVSIVFVLVRWMLTGDAATPYGPYLCAATVVVLVYWDDLWNQWAGRLFELGPATIVGIVVACVVLMGAMLWIWRLIKEALGIAGH